MEQATAIQIPDIGDLFEYQGERYHVDGWLKPAPPAPPMPPSLERFMRDAFIRMEGQTRMVWCVRDEATHVAGYGASGCVAAAEDITILGHGGWSPEVVGQTRRHALALVGEEVAW